MLHLKTSPVGIDAPIQGLQQYLYTQLKKAWKVDDETYQSYGRCYRNPTEAGYVPEVFVSSGQANNTVYQEAWFDDTLHKAASFFDVYDTVKYDDGSASTRVDLIFIVNVSLLKPSVQHRADEEIRRDVSMLCSMPRYNFTMNEFKTGFKNVFNRFDGYLSKDQVTYRDLHPIHVFSIQFNLLYSITDC